AVEVGEPDLGVRGGGLRGLDDVAQPVAGAAGRVVEREVPDLVVAGLLAVPDHHVVARGRAGQLRVGGGRLGHAGALTCYQGPCEWRSSATRSSAARAGSWRSGACAA